MGGTYAYVGLWSSYPNLSLDIIFNGGKYGMWVGNQQCVHQCYTLSLFSHNKTDSLSAISP